MAALASSSRPSFRYVVGAPCCARTCDFARKGGCAFHVAWQINPLMRVGAAQPVRATLQHGRLVRHLRTLGADVQVLPFVHGAYDSVFVKDSAVLARRDGQDVGLMANPLHPERRAEQRARRAGLERQGFRMVSAPSETLEGGDVVLRSDSGRPGGYLGHGFRSSRRAVHALERFVNASIVPLELRDPTLYHLDMAVAVLGDVTFVCDDALTPASLRDLVATTRGDALVRVPLAEARRFALNFVRVGDDVVLAKGVRRFDATLRGLGYTPRLLALSEFHLAGGSAGCLVARVHSFDRVAVRTTAAIRSTAA